ncbi:MAG: transketolase family protein [Candidatus Aminicenantaceae bacterium]
MRNQFVKTVEEVMEQDERLVVFLGDIGVYAFRNIFQKYPDRIFNIGVLEQAVTSLAAGISKEHLKPVIYTITPFAIERCLEQIKVDFCYQRLGGNIVSVGSAFDYAALGCTHHSYSDIALIRSLPGTQVIYPSSEAEFDILFKHTYGNNNFTYFRLPAHKHDGDFNPKKIQLGKGIKVQEGNKLTIVVTGPQLKNVVKASQSYSVDVIYIHTIKPLDTELIRESAQKTGKVLVIEEHNARGGLGDEVAFSVESLPGIIQSRVGIEDQFLTDYGTYEEHCAALGLSAEGIEVKIRSLI